MVPKKSSFWRKLLLRYRLIILNEDTFEEKFSLRLTRLNTFVLISLFALVMITITAAIIAFTPLREYIPGYSRDVGLRQRNLELVKELDSLEYALQTHDNYLDRVQQVLVGDIQPEELKDLDSLQSDSTIVQEADMLEPSREDSLLRAQVDREDRYNIIEGARTKTNFVFYVPVSGPISEGYDAEERHYAVDVVAKGGTPIKAAADGTVIYAGWNVETGHTILLEHSYGLITVYKHARRLTKEQNDKVKAGEVIGEVGSTGELSSGPHLHFELWSNGYPLNPTNFINFN